jgi:hypothetical protein
LFVSRFRAGFHSKRGPMFSNREILVFVAGSLLAAVLTVLGTLYVFQYYLVLHDPNDPLVKQGGLKPSQQIKR